MGMIKKMEYANKKILYLIIISEKEVQNDI